MNTRRSWLRAIPRWIDTVLRFVAAWIIGTIVFVWRCTCRSQPENDPRPALRAANQTFVWAMLHAHAINGTIFNDEKRVVTMLSRSKDGALLVPAFRVSRILPMRGSTRTGKQDKGGQEALAQMLSYVQRGTVSLMIVDGPTGPRNTVRRGVVDLARQANAVIVPVIGLPSRRWIFSKTWDRLQLPKPFSTIRFIMAEPIVVKPPSNGHDDAAYTRQVCMQIQKAIGQMEAQYDPEEAAICAARASVNRTRRQGQSDHTPPTMPETKPSAPFAD